MRTSLWLLASGALLLAGCERSQQTEEQANSEELQPVEEASVTPEGEPVGVDSSLSTEQAEALLARGLGQWEGSGVIKGPDGEVLAEIPLVSTVRWLEEEDEGFRKNGKESGESKVQEMRVTEKLPQGDRELVFTRWYDSGKGLFLLTRRLPGEGVPVEPSAEEAYEPGTETYLGIVRQGMPPGGSFTWTSQMTSEAWIYRGKFLQDDKLEWTRVDTQQPAKEPAKTEPAAP
ncbi:MAG: hypothetical protein MK194_01460 [Roseibacillus sp.]|nr:hypothetical protein [Roseibacillus sp.]